MSEQKLKVHRSPANILKGDRINTYVDMVNRLIKGGRPNKFYPDSDAICRMMDFYKSENNYGLYDTLEVNLDTGLPSEKDVTRIVTDLEIAPKTMKKEDEDKLKLRAEKNPSEVNTRRLNRYYYHRDLLASPMPSLLRLQLKLRSVDTDQYIAFFNVEVDRFDVSESVFVRYTMIVGQQHSRWKQQVHLTGDTLKYTKNFRNLISRYTVDESEFAFVLLNELEDVTVEEVQRCRIGPLYYKGAKIPEGMEEIFEEHPEAFILSFPLDRASIHVREDKNNDPLAVMYRDTLSGEDLAARDRKAGMMRYKVYKERKFACSRSVLRDFRKFLKDRGARCVVYGV